MSAAERIKSGSEDGRLRKQFYSEPAGRVWKGRVSIDWKEARERAAWMSREGAHVGGAKALRHKCESWRTSGSHPQAAPGALCTDAGPLGSRRTQA